MAPVVHLIDAHVYVFRAWFSLPPMLAADGTPCGAAYGFANTLIRYLGERDPSHVACCFDFALTSFRNELFPGYKASRGEQAPAELEPQFALCQAAARALGVPVFEAERYEADDVIAAFGGLDAFPADPLLGRPPACAAPSGSPAASPRIASAHSRCARSPPWCATCPRSTSRSSSSHGAVRMRLPSMRCVAGSGGAGSQRGCPAGGPRCRMAPASS